MAWAFVASRGTATEDLSDTSHSISPSAAIPVGAIAVLAAATDNETATDGESTLHTSVTDTDGHTWTKLLEWTEGGGGADAGATVSLWAAKVTAEIGTADSVTLTLASARTAKVLALAEFSVAAGKTFSEAGQGGGQGTSTSPSATISGLASAARLWLGTVGVESAVTVTEDGDYTQIATASVGSGGSAITLSYGQRIATLTGDTYNPTLSASRDWAAILVALDEVDDAGAGQTLTGTLFSKAPTFPQGTVSPGAVDLAGQLFQMAPTFFAGTVANAGGTQALTGALFAEAPTFFSGTVTAGAVDLAGALFAKAPTFFAGTVAAGAVDLAGVLFQSAPAFFGGTVSQDQTLTGVLFQSTPTFFAGRVGEPIDHPVGHVTAELVRRGFSTAELIDNNRTF